MQLEPHQNNLGQYKKVNGCGTARGNLIYILIHCFKVTSTPALQEGKRRSILKRDSTKKS